MTGTSSPGFSAGSTHSSLAVQIVDPPTVTLSTSNPSGSVMRMGVAADRSPPVLRAVKPSSLLPPGASAAPPVGAESKTSAGSVAAGRLAALSTGVGAAELLGGRMAGVVPSAALVSGGPARAGSVEVAVVESLWAKSLWSRALWSMALWSRP